MLLIFIISQIRKKVKGIPPVYKCREVAPTARTSLSPYHRKGVRGCAALYLYEWLGRIV